MKNNRKKMAFVSPFHHCCRPVRRECLFDGTVMPDVMAD